MIGWAQYTVQLPDNVDRAQLWDTLKKEDIHTMIYYWKPKNRQGGAGTDSTKEDCSVTARICKTVLSLPMHPYLTKEMVEEVTEKIKRLL